MSPDTPMTARQIQVLDFLVKHQEAHGWPPTRKEIATAFGFRSQNASEEHLVALERKGVVKLTSGISRGITVLQRPALRAA